MTDSPPRFAFSITARDGKARLGELAMKRGTIRTPAFMPVGTAATVKGMKPAEVRELGADIILGNTYHLMLRPGAERVARLGGLHKFMDWPRPILTDSGGYQVMSLSALTKVTEEGVAFRSHLDGSRHMLSPERSMEIQRLLGSDIVMALTSWCPRRRPAMSRPRRWSDRCAGRAARARASTAAASMPSARPCSASSRARSTNSFESSPPMRCAISASMAMRSAAWRWARAGGDVRRARLCPRPAPDDRPRYLMGVGKPDDLVGAVERGVDMFDCVLPTRSGRNGQAFSWDGPINIRNARHAEDQGPLDEACGCTACTRFSRAYLHHLVKSGEMLGAMLMTEHNLRFYQDLMAAMRAAIGEGRMAQFGEDFRARYYAKGG